MYYVLYIGRDSKLKDLKTKMALKGFRGSFRVKKLREDIHGYDQIMRLIRDYKYVYDLVIIDYGSFGFFSVNGLIRDLYFTTCSKCKGSTKIDEDLHIFNTKD